MSIDKIRHVAATIQIVASCSAVQDIVASIAKEFVIATLAIHKIVVITARDDVIASLR